MNYKSILIATLQRALSVKRPHESQTTVVFTQWLQDHLPEGLPSSYDAAGNLHVDARLLPDHQTLFVAHVDTVHHVESSQGEISSMTSAPLRGINRTVT